ncbi:unnamed protein product [Prorocentrum cordatum]|uniref:Uncharacterized protein n=1 Tax=Prorocentrum cordatum TaxID=2364126 RepID=A0ABN9R3M7_9DINO|nr:unnamed protein product [Polarella glacialis]
MAGHRGTLLKSARGSTVPYQKNIKMHPASQTGSMPELLVWPCAPPRRGTARVEEKKASHNGCHKRDEEEEEEEEEETRSGRRRRAQRAGRRGPPRPRGSRRPVCGHSWPKTRLRQGQNRTGTDPEPLWDPAAGAAAVPERSDSVPQRYGTISILVLAPSAIRGSRSVARLSAARDSWPLVRGS